MKASKEIKKEKYETPNSVSIEIDYESIICSSPNEISGSGDDFIEGWYVTGWDGITGGDFVKKVIIWRGPDGNNIHCTTNLDKNTWETAKS